MHELTEELAVLTNLRKLRVLGLAEKDNTPEAAAAVHRRHGLPEQMKVKHAQQWLTAPDEGW
jgi:hypothetical protein